MSEKRKAELTEGSVSPDVVDDSARKRKRKRKRKATAASTEPLQSPASSAAVPSFTDDAEGASSMTRNTVYVEGLPYDADEAAVSEFFADCGKVCSVRLARFHDSGRCRGYGHVELVDAGAARAALGKSGEYMGQRYVEVQPATGEGMGGAAVAASGRREGVEQPLGCRTVFVKNLPYDVSEEAVRQSFRVCGKVANVRLAMWNHTKTKKGFGYVEFESEKSAAIAVGKSGLKVGARPVFVDYDTSAPKASFKTAPSSCSMNSSAALAACVFEKSLLPVVDFSAEQRVSFLVFLNFTTHFSRV